MHKVFVERSAEEMSVELSDGRIVPLEDLIRYYERFFKEESSKKEAESKARKEIKKKLKIGKWYRIDRTIIAKNMDEIHYKCIKQGYEGTILWERFELSNKIANQNPYQYPQIMEVYIFKHCWRNSRTQQELQDMCEQEGDGMCDEIICDLELQMRICNGELVSDLVHRPDQFPYERIIKFRDGKMGFFGGGYTYPYNNHPARISNKISIEPDQCIEGVPYKFRRIS